jgi:uncharacterized protein YhfF
VPIVPQPTDNTQVTSITPAQNTPAQNAPAQNAIDAMWRDFCATSGTDPSGRRDVYAFGDSPGLADELLALVLHGPKRATAGLLSDFVRDNEEVPVVGAHSIVLDGRGVPACVLRTTDVEVKPLDQVDARFAWDEGEGDRSLAYWLDAHRRYFTRTAAARGETFDDSELCIFERFDVVWPDSR